MKSQAKIFAISDGRAGIERQAQALAGAIANQIGAIVETKRLNPKAPQVFLPPLLWPNPINALPKEQRDILNNLPDIWVGNGRRAIAYSIMAKKRGAFVVQIQDPKVPCNLFDAVIAPKHDNVKGENVFETLGGLVWYSENQIKEELEKFPKYLYEDREKILVILGGNSKTHKFTQERAKQIIENIRALQNPNRVFFITVSRRTPIEICQEFRNFAQENNHEFFENVQKDGPNPYLAWLAISDIALVTEDSANMLSDCAFFGLPINLIKLQGGSKKFDRLHNSFIEAGAARWFDKNLQYFTYDKINSVDLIAKNIIALWQNK